MPKLQRVTPEKVLPERFRTKANTHWYLKDLFFSVLEAQLFETKSLVCSSVFKDNPARHEQRADIDRTDGAQPLEEVGHTGH